MQKQILEYIDKYLSPHLCAYRKGYSTQTALISMAGKWKLSIDNKGFTGGVLMGLSKAFDSKNHQLLLAKLHAQAGFSKQALLIQWNLPIVDIPNSGHAMISEQNVESQMGQSFSN